MGPLHQRIQNEIRDILLSLGYDSKCEYRGKGWRADVYAEQGDNKFVFEVQLSPQTYKKTEERQSMFLRDGIIACWLFENDPTKKREEKQDLPVFKIIEHGDQLFVSLKGRKELPLDIFVSDFVGGKIKFCSTLKPLPSVEVNFIEFPCYRCGAINHIYFLSPFKSACNVKISEREKEHMWSDSKFSFDKRVIERVRQYVERPEKKYINLATIKNRYSNTIEESYLSFGCKECDALFGDFYVFDTIIDCYHGEGVIDRFTFEMDVTNEFKQDIPHWCHPGDKEFCE